MVRVGGCQWRTYTAWTKISASGVWSPCWVWWSWPGIWGCRWPRCTSGSSYQVVALSSPHGVSWCVPWRIRGHYVLRVSLWRMSWLHSVNRSPSRPGQSSALQDLSPFLAVSSHDCGPHVGSCRLEASLTVRSKRSRANREQPVVEWKAEQISHLHPLGRDRKTGHVKNTPDIGDVCSLAPSPPANGNMHVGHDRPGAVVECPPSQQPRPLTPR